MITVNRNGAIFENKGMVKLALDNNLIDAWAAVDILVAGGMDVVEAECVVGDWNGGVL